MSRPDIDSGRAIPKACRHGLLKDGFLINTGEGRAWAFLRRWRLALLAVVLTPLSGCYLLQAAGGQLQLTLRRQPIEQLLGDERTSPALRERLAYVAEARRFASQTLALPDNDSYRSYADLRRPFVVWNVFAAEEFSVEPRSWCFPIAGCVVYRGYFSEQQAWRYARQLRRRGLDVAVGGVAAYSTLGHFADPVLNTMLGWDDARLAGTLFHELAHQVAYVPGDSQFNESFATVVEEAGLQRWLEARAQPELLQGWYQQRERNAQFIELLLQTRQRLEELYASTLPAPQMRERKQEEFGALKLRYAALKEEWGGYAGYDSWFAQTLSNAHLVSAATYYGCVPGLQRVLDEVGGDLPRFYARVQELAKAGEDARRAVCEQPGS